MCVVQTWTDRWKRIQSCLKEILRYHHTGKRNKMIGWLVLVSINWFVSCRTGEKVKIPGKTPWEPNCYPFGTTYEGILMTCSLKWICHYYWNPIFISEIFNDLVKKDKQLYKGLLNDWIFCICLDGNEWYFYINHLFFK